MRDEGQKAPHTSIPYEKSRARWMSRKLGLRVIRSGKAIHPLTTEEVATHEPGGGLVNPADDVPNSNHDAAA